MSSTATSSTDARRQRVQSAETGMSILKALTRLGGVASLSHLSNEVGESASKVHRYISSFVQEGFVAQNPLTQHYYLSTESIRLGLAALRQCDPVRLGESALVRLRESLEVTCFIAVMGNMGPTVLRIEEPPVPVTVNIRAGSVLPILWSATGQAFLAFTDDTKIHRKAQAEYEAGTPEQQSMMSGSEPVDRLRRQIRDQGCAIVNDTLLRGISAVSAPVLDSNGHVCAVLTSLGASNGFDSRPGGAICPRMIKEASDISMAMGYEAP